MTKPVIVTRQTKGSALSWTEGDENLTNLRDATITVTADGTDVVSELNGGITIVGGTNVTVTGDNSAKTITIDAQGGDIVNDTTPQLGGDLDVNGNSIVSTSNQNISITPNGTGRVVLDGQQWPAADGPSGYVLATNGAGVTGWVSIPGSGLNASSAYRLPSTDGTAGQILKTDGEGTVTWEEEATTYINENQPSAAKVGEQWLNPTTQILKVYTSAGWVQVTADDLQF